MKVARPQVKVTARPQGPPLLYVRHTRTQAGRQSHIITAPVFIVFLGDLGALLQQRVGNTEKQIVLSVKIVLTVVFETVVSVLRKDTRNKESRGKLSVGVQSVGGRDEGRLCHRLSPLRTLTPEP